LEKSWFHLEKSCNDLEKSWFHLDHFLTSI
jgi:hypothetical protein